MDRLHALLDAHGLPVTSFEPITTGKFNDSYFVDLEDGRRAVLRVAPPDDAGFLFYERGMMAQEPGLHRLLREKTSLPVAEILFYDDTRTVLDRDCLLMTRLHGAALSETTLAPRATDRVLEEMGAYLRELHDTCQADQYGYLGEHHCMAPADTWVEAFRTMWGLLIDDIAACGVYDPDEAASAKALLEKHIDHFDREVPSCLLHMDIWAQNILVDGHGRVTG
ncbi:aminoglycoside phosphotransferase family protein, partial [bacterium]|nr:aminoglycoside phosphotransferase family protein [bacterium]